MFNPRGQQAFDVSVAFTVIAFISVVLRLYTRWFLVRAPGIEDHLIIVAMVSPPPSQDITNRQLILLQSFSIALTVAIAYRKYNVISTHPNTYCVQKPNGVWAGMPTPYRGMTT